MTAPVHLTQVKLGMPITINGQSGWGQDVFWIDSQLAKVGKRVKDDEHNVWTVLEVYGTRAFIEIDKQRAAWKRWAEVLGC